VRGRLPRAGAGARRGHARRGVAAHLGRTGRGAAAAGLRPRGIPAPGFPGGRRCGSGQRRGHAARPARPGRPQPPPHGRHAPAPAGGGARTPFVARGGRPHGRRGHRPAGRGRRRLPASASGHSYPRRHPVGAPAPLEGCARRRSAYPHTRDPETLHLMTGVSMDIAIASAGFLALAGVVFLLARPFDRRILAGFALLAAVYLAVDDLVTGIPNLVPAMDLVGGDWNWMGKILSLVLSVVVIVSLRLSPAAVGLTWTQRHPKIGVIAVLAFIVWGTCLGLLFQP